MRILFDQGTPVPLRHSLVGHAVETVFERGWAQLTNGELLAVADSEFDILITTDQNLKYQQDLSGRRIAVVVLMTTSWPRISRQTYQVIETVSIISAGDYIELNFR